MLKLLVLFPLMLVGGALALGLVLPFMALLPIAFALGAVVLALGVVGSIFGLVLRLFAGLVVGAGIVLAAALGFGALFVGGAVVFALGAAMMHLLLPVLVIVGVVWLIRRHSRPAAALPAPHS
jgi:hypothetical protein